LIGQRGFWLGFAGSAAFLAVFIFLFVDFTTIGDVMRNANYAYIAPSLVFYFLAVQARSMRWKYLLRPLMGRPRKAIYPVVVIGYMANNLIPVRIGEVLRSYYLSLRESVSAAGAFGTVAVERASDVLALLFFLAISWAFLPAAGAFGDFVDAVPGGTPVLTAVALLPFAGVLGVVLVITIVSQDTILRLAARVFSPLPAGLEAKAMALSASLLQGLSVVNSPKAFAVVFLYSLPVWAFEAAMYYLIGMGFDLSSQFDSQVELIAVILVFTAAANLAGVLPSSAGSWGPFDFFGAAALVALGVPNAVASGFALTVHVALWVPVTVLGAIMLLADGSSLRRLVEGVKRDREDGQSSVAASEVDQQVDNR
jgi:uncharacterized protein (TIRG00374 family)